MSPVARGRGVRRRNPGRASAAAADRSAVPPAPWSAPNPGGRTALQKHVDFFDTNHDGRITLADTYGGLRRLGLGAVRSAAFSAVINVALGSSTTVDADSIHAGRHRGDTGVYDENGRFSPPMFRRLFASYDADGDGALDREDLTRLFADHRTDLIGRLGAKAEFGLLLELAGESRAGTQVLTRERLERFYDGSLFDKLAEQVAARRVSAWAMLRGALNAGIREIY